jgi:hypothetical protein
MARDVQQLVQLAQSKQPEHRQQQQQRSTAVPPEQPAGSDRSDDEGSDSGAESDGQAGGKQQPDEDEVDVDTLLAQAAAEVCVACKHEL